MTKSKNLINCGLLFVLLMSCCFYTVTESKPLTLQDYIKNDNLQLQALRNDPLGIEQDGKPQEGE